MLRELEGDKLDSSCYQQLYVVTEMSTVGRRQMRLMNYVYRRTPGEYPLERHKCDPSLMRSPKEKRA
jgi:hypothetical protein